MSLGIFHPDFVYPPLPPVGGHGGESGGAGASGTWAPEPECPPPSMGGWDLALARYKSYTIPEYVPGYGGDPLTGCPAYWYESTRWFYAGPDGDLWCKCYWGVVGWGKTGEVVCGSGGLPEFVEIRQTIQICPPTGLCNGSYLEYPIGSGEYIPASVIPDGELIVGAGGTGYWIRSENPDTWLDDYQYAELYAGQESDYCGAFISCNPVSRPFSIPWPFLQGTTIPFAPQIPTIGIASAPLANIIASIATSVNVSRRRKQREESKL